MLLSTLVLAALLAGPTTASYCRTKKPKPKQTYELTLFPHIDCNHHTHGASDHFHGTLKPDPQEGVDKHHLSPCLEMKNVSEAKSIVFSAVSREVQLVFYSGRGCMGGTVATSGSYATPDGVTESLEPYSKAVPKSWQVGIYGKY
ncbi:hypothetical protein BV22DRAFT_1195275 [Leucogyrophana mollusca]|uniref:Uncharacterized protein n=1 Tax=Leucogyrophana mollusca TaxID=85980 RepID=A0ACB8BKC9_9AGAM|nr:hypothetical protein BV22DRAFT_1195275 [Leucogyrophana mollusca]